MSRSGNLLHRYSGARVKWRSESRGQALVELALALPLFLMVLIGIVVLGIIIFYNQQLANAAREAARFAAVHSASAQCPVVSTLEPAGSAGSLQGAWPPPASYVPCDAKPWPQMTAFAQSKVFGLDANSVVITACWSGYQTATQYDTPPPGTYEINGNPVTIDSQFVQCSIDNADPTADALAMGCADGLATEDTASDISEGQGRIVANRVTAYACYVWQPPAAGFLLIPETVTLRAVISEPIQRQQ